MDPKPTGLTYAPPQPSRTPCATVSFAVAVAGWVIGHGGFALWDSRTIPRPPMQADFGHDMPLLVSSLLTLLIAPAVGIAFAAHALRSKPQQFGFALSALFLNVWIWAYPVLFQRISHDPTLWWSFAVSTATADVGVLLVYALLLRRVDPDATQ